MAVHHFDPDRFYTTIGSHAPVLTIASGDTVVAQTVDAHGFDRHGGQPAMRPNPMTGPFFVAEAEPGDALRVQIDDIRMRRATGWTYQVLSANVVDPGAVHRFPAPAKTAWLIDIEAGLARLAEPPPRLADCHHRRSLEAGEGQGGIALFAAVDADIGP